MKKYLIIVVDGRTARSGDQQKISILPWSLYKETSKLKAIPRPGVPRKLLRDNSLQAVSERMIEPIHYETSNNLRPVILKLYPYNSIRDMNTYDEKWARYKSSDIDDKNYWGMDHRSTIKNQTQYYTAAISHHNPSKLQNAEHR